MTGVSLLEMMRPRRGHFEYESGLHGDIKLDLTALLANPRLISGFLDLLSDGARSNLAEVVCGPLLGGSLIGFSVAERTGLEFVAARRDALVQPVGLTRFHYVLECPPARLAGRRVVVVDDVVNAGSAVGSTLEALSAVEAVPVGLGALLTLGDAAHRLAQARGIPLFSAAAEPMTLWRPGECPMCSSRQRLERAI